MLWATASDIEIRLGFDVPVDQEPKLYALIADVSAMVDIYATGSTPEALKRAVTASAVVRAWASNGKPVYRQETVGDVSVTRDSSELTGMFLNQHEIALLQGSNTGRGRSVTLTGVDITSTLYEVA